MQRAEKIGLGAAVAGHVVLFGLLSVGFLATPNPDKLMTKPMDVSFAEEVATEQVAPAQTDAPAVSQAQETGAPEDAAPPEAAAEPEPAPEPEPEPAPPAPAPRPQPRPEPRPAPKPVPAPKPAPKPVPKPAPKAAPAPKTQPKPAPAKPAPAKPAPAKPAPARPTPTRPAAAPKAAPKAAPTRPAAAKPAPKPAATRGQGTSPQASAQRPRGSRLGNDFLKGISDQPTPGKAQTPRAAAVGPAQVAGLGSAIRRQVQPCANRVASPGPGANQITSKVVLQMRPDGSLAARPTIRGQTGVDGENERYAQRVGEMAIAAFIQCAPYELPADLYEGGWKTIIINYNLPR